LFEGNDCDIEKGIRCEHFDIFISGPENGQNYGQIGGKFGYAANKTN